MTVPATRIQNCPAEFIGKNDFALQQFTQLVANA
jgi:hypothetical protein